MGRSRQVEPQSPEFSPVRMHDVEIGAPLEDLSRGETEDGTPFGSCLCLVRLHGRPLGTIEVELPPGGVSAEALAARIQGELGERVSAHLREDGLPAVELDAGGIPGPEVPACAAAREEMLA